MDTGTHSLKIVGYVKEGVYSVVSVAKGLWVTLTYLPRKKVTLQYPTVKRQPDPRFRGQPVLVYDYQEGKFACTACMACQNACPTQTIKITTDKDEAGKRRMTEFEINSSICMFCGLCVEACNFAAIEMSDRYETSVYDPAGYVYDKEALKQTLEETKKPYTWSVDHAVKQERARARAEAKAAKEGTTEETES
jgi:NADH-quinone oxidoreductase chain I